MLKSAFFIIIILPFLVSCTPQKQPADSSSNEKSEKSQETPQDGNSNNLTDSSESKSQNSESQQEGYMKIIGDLRWDQLTSTGEWMQRFPECLFLGTDPLGKNEVSNYTFRGPNRTDGITRRCEKFSVSDVFVNVERVNFKDTTGTASGSMSSKITFTFADKSGERAIKGAIANKYPLKDTLYCSKYTCWGSSGDLLIAYPTNHTISILDNVKVDSSDL